MKRFLAMLLAAAAALSLAGCQKPQESPTTQATSASAQETTKATSADEKIIRVATPGNYTPFTIYNEATKEWSGFEIDLWNKIGEKTGYKIEFVKRQIYNTSATGKSVDS